ncbi:hypothetical protein UA08_04545 [Talaromyces atroroseus]|uniref:Uncharacterized protein n=1 Tax=Talaromyces atroroseus TaxID=1441469 RepID=A0A225AY99_TALAT|nr:hypothetical protein UA08_04545 [Talaromyces atroroseus]OKL59946.1 hypothetical protein UA08_04545 [Talaromyces atroroseus]
MQPKRTASPHSKALEPSPMADISLSLRTAFMDNAHYRRESDSLSTSALSSASGSPASSPTSGWPLRKHRFSGSHTTEPSSRDRSRSPYSYASIIPFSFRRSSPFFLRRRPSAVDLALSEERSRCDEDSVERLGLSMMEPRPVDPIPIAMDLNTSVLTDIASQRSSFALSTQSSIRGGSQQPRYVMGGIVEVMEGNA